MNSITRNEKPVFLHENLKILVKGNYSLNYSDLTKAVIFAALLAGNIEDK